MQTIYCNWWDAEEPRKGARDIDGQKSNQEKIKIRTLRTVGHGTRLAKSSPTLAKDARVGHPGGLGGSRVGHPPKILNNAAFTVNVTTPIHTHSKATSPARILPAVPVDMNFDRVRIEHFLLPSKSVSGDRNV